MTKNLFRLLDILNLLVYLGDNLNWIETFPQLLIFGIAIYGIGWILLFAIGSRNKVYYACSPLITVAFLIALSFITLFPWDWIYVLLATAIVAVSLFFCTCAIKKLSPRAQLASMVCAVKKAAASANRTCIIALAVGLALNAIAVYVYFVSPVSSPEDFISNYDNAFHYSVVRHILENANASAIGAGSVAGASNSFYPDTWHALCALNCSLFGSSIPVSAWVVCLGIMLFIVPISMGLFTLALTSAPSRFRWLTIICASTLPVLIPTSIQEFCFAFGSLFPNALALSLMPFALRIFIEILNAAKTSSLGKKEIPGSIAMGLIAVVALGLSHPNVAILFVLLITPLLLLSLKRSISALFAICGILLWAAMYNSSIFFRTVNCLDRVQYSEHVGTSALDAFGIDWSTIASNPIAITAIGLFILAIFLIIGHLLSKRWSGAWYVASFGICCTLWFFTLFPQSAISSVLTGFWYRDAIRFMVFCSFCACPLLALIPQAILDALSQRPFKHIGAATGLIGAVCLLFMVYAIARPAGLYPNALRGFNDISSCVNRYDQFSMEERQFSDEVKAIVGNSLVLNNPEDSSVWLYPIYGVNAIYKAKLANYMSSMGADEMTAIEDINRIAEDSDIGVKVREAVRNLSLSYILRMSGCPDNTVIYNSDGRASYPQSDAALLIDESTPGFSLVAEKDGMRLFKIDKEILSSDEADLP